MSSIWMHGGRGLRRPPFYRAIHSVPYILLVMATLASGLVAARRSRAANEIAGKAEKVTGTVILGDDRRLNAGDLIFAMDRISTGKDGSAEIVFIDGSRMKLAAETSLKITAYKFDPKEKIRYGIVWLSFGKVRFAVLELDDFNDRRFRVQTETAVAGSLDTDFIVAYEREIQRDEICRNGLTTALCIENSIILSSTGFQDKPTSLSSYMLSQVCGAGLPTPPRFITSAELARISTGLEQIGARKISFPWDLRNPAVY